MELKKLIIQLNKEIYEINKEVKKVLMDIYDVTLLKYQLQLSVQSAINVDRLMHKQEVIDYLKISERSYYRYKKQGLLIPIVIGGSDYYHESDLQDLLTALKKQGRY